MDNINNKHFEWFPDIVILSGGGDFLLKIWSVLDGSCPITMKGHLKGLLQRKENEHREEESTDFDRPTSFLLLSCDRYRHH